MAIADLAAPGVGGWCGVCVVVVVVGGGSREGGHVQRRGGAAEECPVAQRQRAAKGVAGRQPAGLVMLRNASNLVVVVALW